MTKEMTAYEEIELKIRLFNYGLTEWKIISMFEKKTNGKFELTLKALNTDSNSVRVLAEGFDEIRKCLDEALRDKINQQRIIQRLNGMREWWVI